MDFSDHIEELRKSEIITEQHMQLLLKYRILQDEKPDFSTDFWREYATLITDADARRQHMRMVEDLERYPDNVATGAYRDIPWRVSRIPGMQHYCGYLTCDPDRLAEINPDYQTEIESHFHGGETAMLGFDCAHAGDYVPCTVTDPNRPTCRGVYRNREYVIDCIKRTVDAIYHNAPTRLDLDGLAPVPAKFTVYGSTCGICQGEPQLVPACGHPLCRECYGQLRDKRCSHCRTPITAAYLI